MSNLESFGEEKKRKTPIAPGPIDHEKKVNQAIAKARAPYHKEYYLKNKETIVKRSLANQKNPIKREEANQARRLRRQISKGIK